MVDPFLTVVEHACGITCNSNYVKQGYIFVAIDGRLEDGNQYAFLAESKGAIAIVSDHPERLPSLRIPVIPVSNARSALAELAAHFYRYPSYSLKLVGVTGSNGKTTIAHMLEHIFRYSGLKAGLIGTVNVKIGEKSFPSKLTTPAAPELQSYLAEMRDAGVTHAVMEVSAQGMELHRTDYTRYECGILTNICPDHLDFHGEFGSYLSAKAKFLELLRPEAPLIVNMDDYNCREIMKQFKGRTITCSMKSPEADLFISSIQADQMGLVLAIKQNCILQREEKGEIWLRVPLLGKHNAENVLLTYAAAKFLDLQPEIISNAFREFPGVERRMNVFKQEGVTVIDDTALNPGSIDAVFDTVRYLRYRNLYVVNAIRGKRGSEINAINAAAIAGWQRKLNFNLVVTSSSDRVGQSDWVNQNECQNFVDVLNSKDVDFIYFETLKDSIKHVVSNVKAGDVAVLIGAQGMDDGRKIFSEYIKQDKIQNLHPSIQLQYS